MKLFHHETFPHLMLITYPIILRESLRNMPCLYGVSRPIVIQPTPKMIHGGGKS